MACVEITPDDFDDMHHALGRPDLATLSEGENYRNYFATEAGSPWAVHAETLGVWDRITREGAGIVTYRLNADGKSALADWLSLQEPAERAQGMFNFVPGQQYEFRFRNYRGEDETRHVIFQGADYGSNAYYPTPHWFIRCWDIERGEPRSFLLSNIDVESLSTPAGDRSQEDQDVR